MADDDSRHHVTLTPVSRFTRARHLLVSGSADASSKTWDLRVPGQIQAKLVHPNHFEEVCAGFELHLSALAVLS